MRENIRLLEDRVAEAAKRMKRLSDEKAKLNLEATTLRKQLAAAKTGKTTEQVSDEQFASERSFMASKLREARELLRDA
jgi:regulator of replication initiation timing